MVGYSIIIVYSRAAEYQFEFTRLKNAIKKTMKDKGDKIMASLKGTQTEKNLLTSFAGESQARNRYTYFASAAKKEGFIQISDIFTETANQDNTIYMIELSYGAAKTEISAWRMASKNSFVSSTGQSAARGSHIPAGETVYARMMCATAGAKTLNVHFRHYLHP